MTIDFVNSVSASSANNSTVVSAATNMTGADCFVMLAGTSRTPGLSAIKTDSEGNSYVPGTTPNGPGSVNSDLRGTMLIAENAISSSSMTFSIIGSTASYPGEAVAGYSGVRLSGALDVESGTFGSGITSLAPGTVSPSEDGSLIVSGLCTNNTNLPTTPSGFTERQSRALVAAFAYGVSLGDQIQTVATPRNPSRSWVTNNNNAVALAMVLKPEPAAAGGLRDRRFPRGVGRGLMRGAA